MSTGRIPHNFKDRTGQRYGRLVVLKRTENRGDRSAWVCQCDCGGIKVVTSHELQCGKTKSCGCLDRENRKRPKRITHNESYTRLHDEWRAMKWRCSPKYHDCKRYYDRGIRVCDEWQEYIPFRNWAIENGYSDALTLDRINNDGNYEPSNCRWATQKEQANNTSKNVIILYKGRKQTLKQWSEELGLNYGMLKVRHRKGWTGDKLFMPSMRENFYPKSSVKRTQFNIG